MKKGPFSFQILNKHIIKIQEKLPLNILQDTQKLCDLHTVLHRNEETHLMSPTVRWSLFARGWQRLRRVSTVCGGEPSPTTRPEPRSTADPTTTGSEECHHQSGSVSRAGGWEPWPRWGQFDASMDQKRSEVNRMLSYWEIRRTWLFSHIQFFIRVLSK